MSTPDPRADRADHQADHQADAARAALADVCAAIEAQDMSRYAAARDAATAEMDGKLKPPGSLGRLETLAVRLAGATGSATPRVEDPVVVVCAADHGITAQGVSAFPAEITGLMLRSFATGGAAVNVLAQQAGARLVVADLGTVAPPELGPDDSPVLDLRVRAGTADSTVEEAMTREEAERALAHGIRLGRRLIGEGADLLVLGEMGIGNTTTAAALSAALLGRPAEAVCGRGTGVDDAGYARKVAAVQAALDRHDLGPDHGADPVTVLAAVGGLEIAALAGVVLGGVEADVPVLLDGFITGAAALVAQALSPTSTRVMIAGHLSAEPGHAHQLEALGLDPLLRLDLRLGEASGGCLAVPLVRAAAAVLAQMATFASLGLAP
ncbi:nicotinate-nucleotide--dimethylbenzimidazole phosphoribosyltransferase [Nocardioidaceae bacterium]|nr:nicotinate-nucleotide--dimethylbenzimidazole phosphoribosyltransferase [Nocardioidaceae bacterium]